MDRYIKSLAKLMFSLLPVMLSLDKKTGAMQDGYYVVPNSCAVRNNSVGWKIHPN